MSRVIAAKLVKLLVEKPRTLRQLAYHLDRDESNISDWLREFQKQGLIKPVQGALNNAANLWHWIGKKGTP